jgi:hypothetical protein
VSVLAPSLLVSSGTLVPSTPVLEKLPSFLRKPLYLPHNLGVGPSPDRFLADAAYAPLKELRGCWVVPLSWLGLDDRKVSVAVAKVKLKRLLQLRPGSKVILVGQSQGGLVVAELVLDPELAPCILACVMAGAPFKGSPETQRRLLGWSKIFPGVAQMEPGHPSLEDLCQRIEARWPKSVLPVLAGSPRDELVPEESAFGVRFPPGVKVREWHLEESPTARHHHVLMCRRFSLVSRVKNLREEFTPSEQVDRPDIQHLRTRKRAPQKKVAKAA